MDSRPRPGRAPAGARACAEGESHLIVTCEECKTSFQLDESRIPESGAQVRCSRCKHAFFLPHPSASAADATHAVAAEAAQDAMPGVPAATADGEAEEEEWQFSEEVRVEGDEGLDSADGLDPAGGFDADALMAEAGAEPVTDAAEDEAASPEPASEEAEAISPSGLDLESEPAADDRDESSFGTVEDFSSLGGDDETEAVDLGDDPGLQLDHDQPDLASAGTYAASGATDDLGDPESWDLVGSDAPATTRPTTGGLGSGLGSELPGADFAFGDEADDDRFDEASGSRSIVLRGLAGLGSAIGWGATVALVAGVLFVSLRSEWRALQPSPQTVSAAGMQAETARIQWVQTRRAGFAMVVEGRLRNTTGRALRPALAQLSLLDGAGRRLPAEPIPAGAPVDEVTLREAPPAELRSTAVDAALRLRETPLAPGEARPFMAIALEGDLPDDAHRFLLEIVEAPEVGPRLPEVADTPGASEDAGAPPGADQLDDEESLFSP